MFSLMAPNFDDVFASFDNLFNDARFSYNEPFPPKNVFFGDDGTCEITLALAGYSKEELSIRVENDKIIVEAKINEEEKEEEKKGRYYGRKIKKQNFTKVYALDSQTPYNYDGITSTFKNGLLKISVPKKEDSKPEKKTITIQ